MADFVGLAAVATAVFLLAGIAKGTLGIGLPTVSVGLLSQVVPPHTSVALVVFPLLVSNLWQVIRTRAGLATLRRYGVLIGCLVVTLWLATFLTARISPRLLIGIIGAAVVVFAVSSLLRRPPELPDRFDRTGQAVTGISAGVLGGLTSIWSPPLVVYLVARRTEKDEFVRAAGLSILLGGIPLAIGFWQAGLLDGETAPLSLAMVVPSLLGFTLGEAIRRRLDADRFRTVVLWMFLLMGLNLVRRSLF